MDLYNYWRYRKKRKSYNRFRMLLSCYLIIFSVLFLKDIFQAAPTDRILESLFFVYTPVQALSFGWISSIILQSSSIVAVFINTLLGQDL